MAYKLRFHELEWADWQKLDGSLKAPLKKKLLERLEAPRVPSAALSGMADCYEIQLRQAGHRLIYRVGDDVVTVSVIAWAKRDKLAVCNAAAQRKDNQIK